jgi:preprotein translocase SecE subunit
MARQTRAQRRARRAETSAAVEPRRPAARPAAPAVSDGGDGGRPPRPPVARGGRDPFRFFRESYGELRKVEWPSQHQVITGATVVLVACIIVGIYLWANDLLWKHFVQNVLLK